MVFKEWTDSIFVQGLILFILTGVYSYLSAGLTGYALYRSWRPYALMGLWNYLTIIALSIEITRYRKKIGQPKRHSFTAVFFIIFSSMVFAITYGVLKVVF